MFGVPHDRPTYRLDDAAIYFKSPVRIGDHWRELLGTVSLDKLYGRDWRSSRLTRTQVVLHGFRSSRNWKPWSRAKLECKRDVVGFKEPLTILKSEPLEAV